MLEQIIVYSIHSLIGDNLTFMQIYPSIYNGLCLAYNSPPAFLQYFYTLAKN